MTKVCVGPLDEIGIWSIREIKDKSPAMEDQAPVRELACNLASKMESDLRLPEAWQELQTSSSVADSFFVRPIWFYLIGAAWLLAIGEWFLYQRRWIG
jgi:hypothetical protein